MHCVSRLDPIVRRAKRRGLRRSQTLPPVAQRKRLQRKPSGHQIPELHMIQPSKACESLRPVIFLCAWMFLLISPNAPALPIDDDPGLKSLIDNILHSRDHSIIFSDRMMYPRLREFGVCLTVQIRVMGWFQKCFSVRRERSIILGANSLS